MFRSFSLGELFIAKGVPDSEDVDKAREYLATKWGVEEPPETDARDLPRWYAKQQGMLQLSRHWSVLSPRLFRYLDQQYIDAFFDSGDLRISSFAHFATHEDEERQDQEGWTVNIGRYEHHAAPSQNVHVYNVSGAGADAYVLCASLVTGCRRRLHTTRPVIGTGPMLRGTSGLSRRSSATRDTPVERYGVANLGSSV